MERIRLLKLEVDADSIRYSILTARLPTRPASVTVESDTIITVRAGAGKTSSLYYQIQSLKEHLPGVVIKGLPSVARAVIAIDDSRGAPRSVGDKWFHDLFIYLFIAILGEIHTRAFLSPRQYMI